MSAKSVAETVDVLVEPSRTIFTRPSGVTVHKVHPVPVQLWGTLMEPGSSFTSSSESDFQASGGNDLQTPSRQDAQVA